MDIVIKNYELSTLSKALHTAEQVGRLFAAHDCNIGVIDYSITTEHVLAWRYHGAIMWNAHAKHAKRSYRGRTPASAVRNAIKAMPKKERPEVKI